MYKKFATIFQYSSEIYSVRTYKSLSLILVFPVDDVSAEVFVRDLDSQGSCWNAWNFARDLESQNICRSTWWSFTLFYSTYSFFEHATHHNFAQFYLLSYLLICRLLPILLGHSSSSRSTTFRFADPRWTPFLCIFMSLLSPVAFFVIHPLSPSDARQSTSVLFPLAYRLSFPLPGNRTVRPLFVANTLLFSYQFSLMQFFVRFTIWLFTFLYSFTMSLPLLCWKRIF